MLQYVGLRYTTMLTIGRPRLYDFGLTLQLWFHNLHLGSNGVTGLQTSKGAVTINIVGKMLKYDKKAT